MLHLLQPLNIRFFFALETSKRAALADTNTREALRHGGREQCYLVLVSLP